MVPLQRRKHRGRRKHLVLLARPSHLRRRGHQGRRPPPPGYKYVWRNK